MTKKGFERLLDSVVATLRDEAGRVPFSTAKQFENRVREVAEDHLDDPAITIDFDPHPQAFPDIAVGMFGIEVKFAASDTWRSFALPAHRSIGLLQKQVHRGLLWSHGQVYLFFESREGFLTAL